MHLRWAELYPQQIESVAIINSSLKQFSPFYKRLLPRNYLMILKAIGETDIFKQENMILQITSNKLQDTQLYLKSFATFASEYKILKFNIIRQLVLANNIKIKQLPRIPFKVIVSQNDRLVSSDCSVKIANNFSGGLYVHPTAGHDLPLDEPAWLVETLVRK